MGVSRHDLNLGETQRTYWVYSPESMPSKPPVVVFFHQEGAGDPDLVDVQTHLTEVSEEEGFVLVIPIGQGEIGQETWDYAGGSDTEFVAEVLEDLKTSVAYDEFRVYAFGMGLGASMAHLMAMTYPQKITGVGTAGGGFVRPVELGPIPSRYIPVVMCHSSEDALYPVLGGVGSDMLGNPFTCSPILDLVWFWVKHNKSPQVPELMEVGDTTSLARFGEVSRTNRTKPVWYYLQTQGGHTWPGGSDIVDGEAGVVNSELDATRVMWDFLSQFSLDQPQEVFDFNLHGTHEDHTGKTEVLWRHKSFNYRAPRI